MSKEQHSCRSCKFLIKEEESWEMPHIWWWECKARPSMANLKSFPFSNTKCKSFVRTEKTQSAANSLHDELSKFLEESK